jgi:transcriptional regulator with XRE-family HTH domain
VAQNDELSEFLRSRRAALTPEAVGLRRPPGRRVPGLRREELAALAGVSVDYYSRLEQGRPITPSEGVLEAIADALRLDQTERLYLHTVGRQSPPARRRASGRPQTVRPSLLDFLDQMGDVPAYVVGRRTDILATNRLARLLFADFDAMPAHERNCTRWLLLDEGARFLFGPVWEKAASDMVGTLRMDAARHPDDQRTAALVGELSMRSEHFRRWWADRKVAQRCLGVKTFHHPLVGEITLTAEAISFPDDPDQSMFIYVPKPASPDLNALRLLAGWTDRAATARS